MSRPNVFRAEFDYDDGDPAGYRGGAVNVGRLAGGEQLAVKLFELPSGEAVCPYHYEYEEEWLLVIDGRVTVRTPEGEQSLDRGELMRFAPGAEGAHKVIGAGDGSAVVMMFSSAREPAVAVYPDSDKVGVWPGDERDNLMLRRADGNRDYWDGER